MSSQEEWNNSKMSEWWAQESATATAAIKVDGKCVYFVYKLLG